MPLCPECIKAHTNQHIQQKEEIHYETLTEAMRLVKSSLSECGNWFQLGEMLNTCEALVGQSLSRLESKSHLLEDRVSAIQQSLYREVDRFIESLKENVKAS